MTILRPKYQQLGPDVELLADEAVLTQAWKKSDTYIRRHNWYADVLELDQTTIELPQLITEWSEQIREDRAAPQAMRLVPAPKNAKWHFPDDDKTQKPNAWCFKKTNEKKSPPLRPLAHLTIRDQTFATAVMLCLADSVETLQGKTDQPSYRAAQMQKVFSYGNRLFCDWKTLSDAREKARFRWGNANTYTQFFSDYQRFLQRPSEVCRDQIGQLHNERLYIVKLDLEKFYDCIDRGALLKILEQLYRAYAEKFDITHEESKARQFFESLRSLTNWQWSEEDKKNSVLFPNTRELPNGLPQGLVASGFFANAYLHLFDLQMGKNIGRSFPFGSLNISLNDAFSTPLDELQFSVRIVDYCRYVDDIRIVITTPEDGSEVDRENKIRKIISRWIKIELISYCEKIEAKNPLNIGDDKTEIISWEDFSEQSRMSQHIRDVQGQISVVPDATTLRQTTGNLDQLLWLAESLNDELEIKHNPLLLSRISIPRMDIRDDTIKRFSANRLRKVLRLRRSMASSDAPSLDGGLSTPNVSELAALDHEMETIARKLIACWARNPALVTVLRCGLDIFPSPELLSPVLEALRSKIGPSVQKSHERAVALYIAADLLKAGAVETGWRKAEDYPDHADITGYRRELLKLAMELLELKKLPWFVAQQAALFLATMQQSIDFRRLKKALGNYANLHSAMQYIFPRNMDIEGALTLALIAAKITGNSNGFAIWLSRNLDKVSEDKRKSLVKRLLLTSPELLSATASACAADQFKWFETDIARFLADRTLEHEHGINQYNKRPVRLLSVVQHPLNPFVHETALLKLAAALLVSKSSSHQELESIDLASISIECDDWDSVQNPVAKSFELTIQLEKSTIDTDDNPKWHQEGYAWIYALGRILRSAIVGTDDYTTRYYPSDEKQLGPYMGTRSTWFKRRMGLVPISPGIGVEQTPLSPWFSELVMRLLQWPGLEISGNLVSEFDQVKTAVDLLGIINKRLKELSQYYGKLSKLPVYLLPTEISPYGDPGKFRVAIVQTLLPKPTDFCAQDPTHWTSSFRSRHREHVAAMCRLVDQQLVAAQSASPRISRPKKPLDLIIFPELSVHPDDMWLLVSLSDRTGATIFSGQTFVTHPYFKKPINRAVWLLRQSLSSGRQIVKVFQGKQYPMALEQQMGIHGYRPYQVIVQFKFSNEKSVNLSGSICYDATDIRLSADLREITDGYVIAALNKDVNTFDSMVGALQYHMYQPVILANTGQFGGSTAQAPFKEPYHRLIAHTHGANQAIISLFEIDLLACKNPDPAPPAKELKAPPAGYQGRFN